MPTQTSVDQINSSDLKPIIHAKPDQRFATTYLSSKNRKYAVNGETLMDKATGEIFTKRYADGKVVSFFQNKKNINDILNSLRITLDTTELNLPVYITDTSVYVSTDFDLVKIFDEDESKVNGRSSTMTFPAEGEHNAIEFNCSSSAYGFVLKLIPRDADKSLMEFINLEYNKVLKDYSGTDPDLIAEAAKFDNADLDDWSKNDAIIRYEVSAYGVTHNMHKGFKINMENSILFNTNEWWTTFPDGVEKPKVRIISVEFQKLRFVLDNIDKPEFAEAKAMYKSFEYPDEQVLTRYLNIQYFLDNPADIDNSKMDIQSIIAMLTTEEVYDFILHLRESDTPPSFILSDTKPSAAEGYVNHVAWAEDVYEVTKGGVRQEQNHPTNIAMLERYLAPYNNVISTILSVDPDDIDAFYIDNADDDHLIPSYFTMNPGDLDGFYIFRPT